MIERSKNSIQILPNVLSSMYAGISDLICMFMQYVFTCSKKKGILIYISSMNLSQVKTLKKDPYFQKYKHDMCPSKILIIISHFL